MQRIYWQFALFSTYCFPSDKKYFEFLRDLCLLEYFHFTLYHYQRKYWNYCFPILCVGSIWKVWKTYPYNFEIFFLSLRRISVFWHFFVPSAHHQKRYRNYFAQIVCADRLWNVITEVIIIIFIIIICSNIVWAVVPIPHMKLEQINSTVSSAMRYYKTRNEYISANKVSRQILNIFLSLGTQQFVKSDSYQCFR